MAKIILAAYTALFIIRFLFHWMLSVLNMNLTVKEKDRIPTFVQGKIDEGKYRKTGKYTLRKENFGLVQFAANSIFILAVIYGGLPGLLDNFFAGLTGAPILQGILYVLAFSLLMDMVSLPFDVYSQFVIEEEYGFNRMTGKTWLADQLKSGLVSLFLGVPLLLLLFVFMEKTGDFWWLYGWVFFSLFQIAISVLYPLIIAPLFNKFTPLEEGELKESLEALAGKCGFKTKGIFLMDGSRRSGHSNAYFTGLGRAKRIVLFDTLVENLTVPELTAVMAHEIGHFKKHHIIRRLLSSLFSTLAVFFLLSLALGWLPLFQAFSFSRTSSHAILIIIMFFSGPFTYFLSPLLSRVSRRHEYQADAYARDVMNGPQELQEALMKLNRDNLSNLNPHPLYSAFYYSHPPLRERWEALNKGE